MSKQSSNVMQAAILWPAVANAFKKLDPRALARNPVMFVVAVVATLTTALFVRDLVQGKPDLGFSFQINLWLWFTVLFANFAEAVAEGRGKAQADSLRKARKDTSMESLGASGILQAREEDPEDQADIYNLHMQLSSAKADSSAGNCKC